MTAPVTGAPEGSSAPSRYAGGPPAPTSPSGPDIWRATRGPLIIVLILVAAATGVALLKGTATKGYLDPAAADKTGSRALVQLLRARGVHVVTAGNLAQARAASTPTSLTVVVRSDYFGRDELSRLAALPGDRMVVEPTAAARTRLAPGSSQVGTTGVRARRPRCSLPAARAAGNADTGGELSAVRGHGARLCYRANGVATLVSYVRHGASGTRRITVLGSGRPLTNQYLQWRGNASLALNLLGGHRTVVWVCPRTPQPGTGTGPTSLTSLLPAPVKLAAVQLAIAVLALALWRLRRLGRLVTEPLPVIVRASETVEGHARLYRSRRARDRAAEVLRAGAIERMRPLLGLDADANQEAVVAAIVATTGGDGAYTDEVLYGSPPADDAALVRLAEDVDRVERQVRQA